jgi:transcriptional regulator with XRE-family HTH domain
MTDGEIRVVLKRNLGVTRANLGGLSGAEVARRAGLWPKTVRLLDGDSTIRTLVKISAGLGVPIAELVAGLGEAEDEP